MVTISTILQGGAMPRSRSTKQTPDLCVQRLFVFFCYFLPYWLFYLISDFVLFYETHTDRKNMINRWQMREYKKSLGRRNMIKIYNMEKLFLVKMSLESIVSNIIAVLNMYVNSYSILYWHISIMKKLS